MRAFRSSAALCLLALPGCTLPTGFECQSDDQCGAMGRCEPTAFCSLPDAQCPSGRRYSEFSGARGGACVDEVGTSTTTMDATTAGSATSSSSTTSGGSSGVTTIPVSTTATSTSTSDGGSTGASGLDPDLVAWYPMESVTDNGTPDVSGNGLDAGCEDGQCPVPDTGLVGGGARLDGVDDFYRVVADPQLDLTEAFTVSIWANLDQAQVPAGDFWHFVARPFGDSSVNSLEVYVSRSSTATTDRMVLRVQADPLSMDTTLEAGVWMNLIATYDGTTRTLYRDGVEVLRGDSMTPVMYDDHDFFIGADEDADIDKNYLPGVVDDVRIYSRAFSAEEAAALYEARGE